MKQCSNCHLVFFGEDEDLAKDFYRNRSTPDGFQRECKFCIKLKNNKPKTPFHLVPFTSQVKVDAERQVFYMTCRGELPKPQDTHCEFCEEPGFKYGHYNYYIPEDTIPLCRDHHAFFEYLSLQDNRIPME